MMLIETNSANDSEDPSTTTGGTTHDIVKVVVPASEAILDPDGVGIRAPARYEGDLLWEMARDTGTLDLNSPYAYMMQCRNFQSTCAIAEVYTKPAGFITAHKSPDRPDILFVWQIAVLPQYQGLGIAKRMLDHVLARNDNADVCTVEATVTPSNKASAAFFASFAQSHNAELSIETGFSAEDFPDDLHHEDEELFVISPVAAAA